MNNQNFIREHIDTLKKDYPIFRNYQDYHVFIFLCIKYFFFAETNSFDPDSVQDYLTDGSNDGGIDAIFNDPNSENNDMIIIQCKYYENSTLNNQEVFSELCKISETIKAIDNHKVSALNEQVVSAYRNAKSQMEDSGNIKVVFFTSYAPKNLREQNKIEKVNAKMFNAFDFEMNFFKDIVAQIETIDNGKLCVEQDSLNLDRPNNYLSYEESVIVNISASSLQDLQNRRRNGLLGMNLRYFVRKKEVDNAIQKTISEEPQNFWYKNNGIIIICENYEIDGKVLRLYNFSIINGGQTTNRIGRSDINEDFFLQCKVVKTKGITSSERDSFALSIAEASNAQKPIKKSDLKSNTPEQLRLRERLLKKHIYYITKKGDKAPKQFSDYQITSLEKVGKLSLATILQMPGSARSNSQRMYNDNYYYSIFGQNSPEGVIADALKISWYYDRFKKTSIKGQGLDEKTVLPMMKNGKTFQLAAITFLCKINYNVFSYESVANNINNTDQLKQILQSVNGMFQIISQRLDNEENIFYEIFSIIGDEVLGYCFQNAVELAVKDQHTLAPSDYLKSDNNYYKDIIPRLWRMYHRSASLQNAIMLLCGTQTKKEL